jgi:hypothetical protein
MRAAARPELEPRHRREHRPTHRTSTHGSGDFGLRRGPSRRVIRAETATLFVVAALFAIACGVSPTQPTSVGASTPPPTASSPAEAISAQAGAALTPADLLGRGWACRPIPGGTGCSHPNQGFPSHETPPEDRPAVFTVLAFDTDGAFIGPATLLRADLYHGQPCESTRAPYTFFPLIGYYFCVRTAGM